MCQKSSYERRCEDCNSRVIIHVVTHQVCNGKPPVSMNKAEKQERKKRGRETPYRKDGFICQRRIRPYKRYWSWVGSHACWYCSLRKQKKEAEEQLKTLLADGSRTETELPDSVAKADESTWKSLEYLSQRSFEEDEGPNDEAASPDSPATSDGEPSSLPALDKGKEKAVATIEMDDVPSEATRSSPLPGANRMGTQDKDSDVEVEDRESSEVQGAQTVDMSIARGLTLAALSRVYGWSDRL
ncbi:hypothetical protein FDENT_1105 [Fusarium denticulatum]|uniref:Uncharacterized protein n=1 Tax=Fusarium denticulatum TaxID=48507 RepID=A0A8H5XIP9_9HYPO|nr:hypothetical protein FDENT_1105 [Fusarium denticulatum]